MSGWTEARIWEATMGLGDELLAGGGDLVTESLDYDGGRPVTVYVPPAPPEAIVFARDGQLISQCGGVLEGADAPFTMIIGVHRLADETPRLHEYSLGLDTEWFAAHESSLSRMSAGGQGRDSDSCCPPSALLCAVCRPVGAGACDWASASGHHGAVFCASPGGGYRPPVVMPVSLLRAYLVAGTLEPSFLENATR
jgi:hypothetical protein